MVLPRAIQGERFFRWRGGDVSRIEALSDAAFAFALTLLVVSLEVPRSFGELMEAVKQFPAFAACFAFLIWCWFLHYRFHRRFGFENTLTVFFNALLLFLILFYVYPLKFVASILMDQIYGNRAALPVMQDSDWRTLMIFYSLGFTAIFGVYVLMNVYAYRKREALELDRIEVYLTRVEIRAHLLSVSIGVTSLALALIGGPVAVLSGVIYFLMGPLHGINGWLGGRGVERMLPPAAS